MHSLWLIIKNTGIYFIGTILAKAIALLMIPLYTHYISPTDYGFYDLSVTYITVTASIIFLNLNIACLRFFLDKKEKSAKIQVASNIFVLFFISFVFYSIGFGLFSYFKHIEYLWLIYLYGLLSALLSVYLAAARGYEKNKIFVITGIITSIINASLSAVLLWIGWDFSALFISMIVADIFGILFLEYELHIVKNFTIHLIDSKLLKNIFYFSLPLVLNGCSYWLCSSFSKVVISSKLGIEANGLYAIAGKFGMVISLAGSCFSLAWQEMSYKKTSEPTNNAIFFSKAFTFYLKFILALYIVLIPCIQLVFPYVVATPYHTAQQLVALYMLWVILDMITNFLGNIITGFKWTNMIFATTFVGGITSVGLLYTIVPSFELNGASFALSCGFLMTWLLRWILLKKRIGITLQSKALLFLIPAVCLVASNLVKNSVYMLILMSIISLLCLQKELKQIYTTIRNKIQSNASL